MYNLKKTAIFGFCRVLRKQSGRLFLASSQSAGSKETRVEHQFKRAAMFGLDARIALAIFGALSVISGAALYSAIKQAKVVQVQTGLSEILKATEAYYLDTGQQFPQLGDEYIYIGDLLVNREGLDTWKGPYLSGEITSYVISSTNYPGLAFKNATSLAIGSGYTFGSFLQKTSDWASNSAMQNCVVNSVDCAEWIYIYGLETVANRINSEGLFADLDKLVDDSDGETKGNIRMLRLGTNDRRIFFKGLHHKRK